MARVPDQALAHWVRRICGIEEDRVLEALARVDRLRAPALVTELRRGDLDSAVGALLLVEGVDQLVAHGGVPAERLHKKLRLGDPWATWAEIRVAVQLLSISEDPVEVHLEPGASQGRHPDWAFSYADSGTWTPIEVKAVGLSDAERAFCVHYARQLKGLVPQAGFTTMHTSIDNREAIVRRADRRHSKRRARSALRSGGPLFDQLHGLRGATFVAHDSEYEYRRRITNKIHAAAQQLPPDRDGWVAFHWSNGAPIAACAELIDWQIVPRHVAGVLFVGQAVAFPDADIHCYTAPISREARDNSEHVVESVDGEPMSTLAAAIKRRFDRSAGVRPTILQAGAYRLMYRDGTRPILPFNLLVDADPDPEAFEAPGVSWTARA